MTLSNLKILSHISIPPPGTPVRLHYNHFQLVHDGHAVSILQLAYNTRPIPKPFFQACLYRAKRHRAVIFAMAQLSCCNQQQLQQFFQCSSGFILAQITYTISDKKILQNTPLMNDDRHWNYIRKTTSHMCAVRVECGLTEKVKKR